jgi:hypothetical protein
MSPDERAKLAEAISRPRHLTKGERPEDKLALLLSTEKDTADAPHSSSRGSTARLVGNAT